MPCEPMTMVRPRLLFCASLEHPGFSNQRIKNSSLNNSCEVGDIVSYANSTVDNRDIFEEKGMGEEISAE